MEELNTEICIWTTGNTIGVSGYNLRLYVTQFSPCGDISVYNYVLAFFGRPVPCTEMTEF